MWSNETGQRVVLVGWLSQASLDLAAFAEEGDVTFEKAAVNLKEGRTRQRVRLGDELNQVLLQVENRGGEKNTLT